MKRNLTVQLDEEVIDKARILAARKATSVSRFVAEQIEQLVADDDAYQRARDRAVRHLEKGYNLGSGGRLPDRDSLHDR